MLGGGGAVGHGYHGGLLAALEEHAGWDARTADVIVGTSSGATVAGLVRAGLSGTDLASRACAGSATPRLVEIDARRRAIGGERVRAPVRASFGLPASPRGAWAAARPGRGRSLAVIGALLPKGRVPTVTDGGPLDGLFPDGWPSERLWIAAVDLDRGRRVFFGRAGEPPTDVPTAVAASCALPGLFAPVVVDRRRFIDGAVWSATNADVLADERLDVVIVSAPLSGGGSPLHQWQRRQLRRECAQLRASGTEVVVIEPTAADAAAIGVNIMNRSRRPAVTRRIRASMAERLQSGDLARHRELISSS